MRVVIVAAFFLIGAALPASSQQPQQDAAVPVGVVKAERKPVAKSLDFVGRVEAVNRVDVKARITGFLEAVEFKEGDEVKAGDPLYKIEKGLFQAAVDQAQGAVEKSKSAKVLTTVQLQRAAELLAKNAGTVVARDQAQAADQQADGAILVDKANLDTAKINLGYTDIISPIDGKVSRTNITVGNVVSPQSGPLTTIVSQDPMYVTFPVSQRDFLQARESEKKIDITGIKVGLRFADGRKYDQGGTINFVDVSVSRETDTVLVRATFPNPAHALIDGQLVRVDLESGNPDEKVVVPQAALVADQEGSYVFVVEDGKAVVKRVKTGGESGTGVVINEGLSGGEQVIVEGLQSIRPGTAVHASPLQQTVGQN
jgi:membrane fusion protein (multidrug efflux system)